MATNELDSRLTALAQLVDDAVSDDGDIGEITVGDA